MISNTYCLQDLDVPSSTTEDNKECVEELPAKKIKLSRSCKRKYTKLIQSGFTTEQALEMVETFNNTRADEINATKTTIDETISPNTALLKVGITDIGYPAKHLSKINMAIIGAALKNKAEVAHIPCHNFSLKMELGYILVACVNQTTAQWVLRTGQSVGPQVGLTLKTMWIENSIRSCKQMFSSGGMSNSLFSINSLDKLTQESKETHRNGLKVAVVAENFRKFKFREPEKRQRLWDVLCLEAAKCDKCIKPNLISSTLLNGSITVECGDRKTVDWVLDLVPTLSLWYNEDNKIIRLKAVMLSDFSDFKKVVFWVKGDDQSDLTIMRKLTNNNDGIYATNWQILDRTDKDGHAKFVVNVEFGQLEIIKQSDWKLSYGSGKIKVKLFIENNRPHNGAQHSTRHFRT